MKKIIYIGIFLIYIMSKSWADEPTCILHVDGEETGSISAIHAKYKGILIIAENGFFSYDGMHVTKVDSHEWIDGYRPVFNNINNGVLIGSDNGLFYYDGAIITKVKGDLQEKSGLYAYDTPIGIIINSEDGIYRYDGIRTVQIAKIKTGYINDYKKYLNGLLLGAEKGLFFFDNKTVTDIGKGLTGHIFKIHEVTKGVLISAEKGLFYFDGNHIIHIEDKFFGSIQEFHDNPEGVLFFTNKGIFNYVRENPIIQISNNKMEGDLIFYDLPDKILIGSSKGLFYYQDRHIVQVKGDQTGVITALYKTSLGFFIAAENGLFSYNGETIAQVKGEQIKQPRGINLENIEKIHEVSGNILIAAMSGIFLYDGVQVIHLPGNPTGPVYDFHDGLGGLIASTEKGLFNIVLQPLTSAKITLDNYSQLKGANPSMIGVPTRWIMNHPCSSYADQFGLQIVATNENGEDVAMARAIGFQFINNIMSFEASIPITRSGKYTFRVVSINSDIRRNVGVPSKEITFVAAGLLGWLTEWWQFIVVISLTFLIILNLFVLSAARYSAGAWRLATDKSWGKTVLLVQKLLLRNWQIAQIWLLDLYVRERRKVFSNKYFPFLSMPLTNSAGEISNAQAAITCLAVDHRIWIQGSAGMGKTAIFLHLRQNHFCKVEKTSFSIFRRDGYLLIPIEARRFPEVTIDDKSPSAWLFRCILNILSEGGLFFEDHSLLRAMLAKGTLAVAIDGINEVAREQAVIAFAAEFPATPIFVTSQEPGEFPFKVWHLPRTINEHIEGLLAQYLDSQKAKILLESLSNTGLIQYLHSGYDVRLVIELAKGNLKDISLPSDRIGLYKMAINEAWPEGDDRLELLQAAAWKLISERGPNEDKRLLKPDIDAPNNLLEQLEAVRERYNRSIRLIRRAPPGYEFVHDQMNAYLAACWLVNRSTISVMIELLEETKIWRDGLEAQRTLWGFVSAMLDQQNLESLWIFAGDDDRRGILCRALAERAEREGWTLIRRPNKNT